MDDRELLELAAKGAGLDVTHPWNAERLGLSPPQVGLCIPGVSTCWNPLSDDGDALRLANRLRLSIIHTECLDDAPVVKVGYYLEHERLEERPAFPDGNAEVRRAIVLAAAEIGRRMA